MVPLEVVHLRQLIIGNKYGGGANIGEGHVQVAL